MGVHGCSSDQGYCRRVSYAGLPKKWGAPFKTHNQDHHILGSILKFLLYANPHELLSIFCVVGSKDMDPI